MPNAHPPIPTGSLLFEQDKLGWIFLHPGAWVGVRISSIEMGWQSEHLKPWRRIIGAVAEMEWREDAEVCCMEELRAEVQECNGWRDQEIRALDNAMAWRHWGGSDEEAT